jgi:hypothetical protein
MKTTAIPTTGITSTVILWTGAKFLGHPVLRLALLPRHMAVEEDPVPAVGVILYHHLKAKRMLQKRRTLAVAAVGC